VRVYVEGVGLRGPGLNGWAASRAVLAGDGESYQPAPVIVPPSPLLPANERRRTVQTVKLALAVGAEAFAAARCDAAQVATVFTSSGGDGETLHEILETLASPEPALSPTRFHNSVHNAPAGYWSMANRSRAASSSLCCHDASFAAGLLEAVVQATVEGCPVALIAYDLPYLEPLHAVRSIGATFGAALLLAPAASDASFARVELELRGASGATSRMSDAALEALRRGTPAARSLPLLAALARGEPETLILDYMPNLEIGLAVAPLAADLPSRADCGEARMVEA
jgi:hypothetical protein